MKWNRAMRIVAAIGCGCLPVALGGCVLPLVPLVPVGGRLLADALLDVWLTWAQ